MFAKLLVSVVSEWPSYSSKDENIKILQEATKNGVGGLIDLIFAQTEQQQGLMFVRLVLGLMTASKNGLSISELEDMCSCDDDVLDDIYEWWTPPIRRVPPMLVLRVVRALKPYIVERGTADGTVVLHWYHRQFYKVAMKRYVTSILASHHG